MLCRIRAAAICAAVFLAAAPAVANEIWVLPTYQQDFGGVGVASNKLWAVTLQGYVRFVIAVPSDLQGFQSATIVLIPDPPAGSATLNVKVCTAHNADMVGASCSGWQQHAFTGIADRLLEVDVTGALASRLGKPGASYVAVVASTNPTAATDHFVGLRFRYEPSLPTGVATLGANTFSGTQTAPLFVGNGSGLTNVPPPPNMATLGANTFSGTQTIASGNLDLAANGIIARNGAAILHTTGADSTFVGPSAGTSPGGGWANTAVGARALEPNTGYHNAAFGIDSLAQNAGGIANTAIGGQALKANTSGSWNTALGASALMRNTTGISNTAVGNGALAMNTTGATNTAIGAQALVNSTAGYGNIAIGEGAGYYQTTGSDNIYVGNGALGAAGESGTTYIGAAGVQTRTFIAGIWNTATGNSNRVPVVIDANGQLGTVSSSRRYKDDIRDMGAASSALFKLRPVTFRYKRENAAMPIEYGLIAEEVAEVFPDLVIYGNDGRPEAVAYQTLNVLLLNEVQKQKTAIANQQARIDALERQIAEFLRLASARTPEPR